MMRQVRKHKNERGQAMLLGVIGLLILSIGMYTSYNLSRSVYEKIKLQNAADATAYSLANLEARTFNFIAFTNRAQIANVVQMLEAQSLLSNATYIEGVTGFMGDWSQSTGRLLINISYFPYMGWLRPIGEQIKMVGETVLEPSYNTMKPLVDQMQQWTPQYIKLHTAKNQALFAVATTMVLSTAAKLAQGAPEIIAANDKNAEQTMLSHTLNALNVASFGSAFDPSSFGVGGSADQKAQAKRLLSELVNASRYGNPSTLGASGIAARQPLMAFGSIINLLNSASGGNWPLGGNAAQGILDSTVGKLLSPGFVGTSKLMGADKDSGLPALEESGEHAAKKSDLAYGHTLMAKDHWGAFSSLSDMGFASVRSGLTKSTYCRYAKPDSGYGSSDPTRPFRMLFNPKNFKFKCYDENQVDMRWRSYFGKGGLAPYFKFAPKPSGLGVESGDFNQPDVWVFLNKPPTNMLLSGEVQDLNFTLEQGGKSAELSTDIGEQGLLSSGILPGINALSRAQAYYHRPGAWQEPPNFFNPYWGAKLAPKNAAIKRLLNEVGLGGNFSQLVADNLWMH